MSATGLQTGFACAVEADYARHAAACQEAGLNPEYADRCSLEEAKRLGWGALEELERRGLFPWPGTELEPEGDPDAK